MRTEQMRNLRNLRNLRKPHASRCCSLPSTPRKAPCVSPASPLVSHATDTAASLLKSKAVAGRQEIVRIRQEMAKEESNARRGPGLESIGFVKKRPPALSLRPRHPTSIASSVLKIGNAHSVQYLLTATGPRSEPSHRWPLTSATSATCGTCGRAKPFGP